MARSRNQPRGQLAWLLLVSAVVLIVLLALVGRLAAETTHGAIAGAARQPIMHSRRAAEIGNDATWTIAAAAARMRSLGLTRL